MKIRQWLGFNEDASQYLLRPGELRVLNNLQSRRPGMLLSRKGLHKVYGKYDNEAIFGLYRRATILGNPSDFLWFQKVLVPKELTLEEVEANEWPFEFIWQVRRIEGNQSRIIDTLPIGDVSNFCVAEDRHGRMFIFYGHGIRPRLYRPSSIANVAISMGLDAPKAKPAVIAAGSGYFIENVNVQHGGGAYYSPPELTITGGNPTRPAKLKAIVESGNVVGVDIIDGGADYKTPPKITASFDGIGSGFRGKGNVSASARTVEGFATQDACVISGTTPDQETHTYGETNGTDNNRIMYRIQPMVRTERVLYVNGAEVDVASVEGIQVNDVVTIFPFVATFAAQRSAAFEDDDTDVLAQDGTTIITAGTNPTVTAIDTVNRRVTLSRSWTPNGALVYELTFWRPEQVAYARADYDPERRRFTALVPVASASLTGTGAHATLEFSPAPRGYGLNSASTSSISLTRNNWNKYAWTVDKNTTYRDILYEEYWVGSDYDKAKSKENSQYIGLQASGSRYIKGYSGSVSNKRADVYWPDYSKISVWFCTGTYSNNLNQWSRVDVAVTTEVDPNTQVASKVLKFRLPPTKSAKTVAAAGSSATTGYAEYDKFPGAVSPEVKLYLRECPDSWVTSESQSLPTELKEAAQDRQKWWSPSSGVPRPLVDIVPAGSAVTDQTYIDAVTITDEGRGWQKDTVFAFRLYRANPYDQYTDYNTSVVEPDIARGHGTYSKSTQYIEYKFTAGTPDDQTPHGPPAVLISPAQITIPGDGYKANESGVVRLLSRSLTAAPSTAVGSVRLTWTARVIDTLSLSSVGQIGSVTIVTQGRNYYAEPTVSVRGGGNGYGLSVRPLITDGKITSVQIVDPGTGYTSSPELYTESKRAELTPVMRPAMRGKYRCAYRYIDMSETVVKTTTAVLGDSSTTLTLSDASDVEAGMALESPSLPHYCIIKSVNGNQVEINQTTSGLSTVTPITVVVRDLSKPIAASDLSPLTDVDAGPNDSRTHSSEFRWSLPGATPPARADKVELWRTSADQSLVYYRIEAFGRPTQDGVEIVGTDTLTDEQLFDPDRPHYAAMPIVLPSGGVNAFRFGSPRTDMSVAVAFQDRLWMGVSTSGEGANTLYYSEFDEFESTPDVNELPIQNNQKSTDVLTALAPFGSMLLAMQHTHTYAVSYNTDPAIDGTIQMISHRGCLHQRCWDIHENVLYAADESGIYSMERNGEVKDISLPLRDYFVSELIDFSKRETFFLQTDPRTHILRFFCCLKANAEDTPVVALCFDIMAQTWWTESYPNGITASCTGRPGSARLTTILLGASDGNLYELDADSDHANSSLTDCFVATGGSGYREAPEIKCPNIKGAVVKGVVSEGRLVDVIIHHAGWDASWGIGLLTEAGDPLHTHDGLTLQGVEYDAIKLDVGAPESGGVQAVAYANFAVTPTVKRLCTVSQGEDYVRLSPARITAFEPDSALVLAAENGDSLVQQNGGDIELQPLPVEIGMEAVGDYIPLNAFVTRIDRNNVHLAHQDGTPVSMLFGAARTNQAGTPDNWLENGGTPMRVTFYKPFRTHVPFRMATGFMQLANEENTKKGDSLIDRSVTLVYTPTPGDKEVEIIERFNGREEMRPNAMRRSRGGPGGFEHRQDSASTVLNTSRTASHLGFSTGVATAKFASRVYTDMTGEDQHLQVELYARPEQASPWQRDNFWNSNAAIKTPHPFALHSMTVNGVVEDAQQP